MAEDMGTLNIPAKVNLNLAPNLNFASKKMTVNPFRGGYLFSPPQTPQTPQATPAKSSKGELTTAGKVMKWVGIGLIGEGALTMGLGAATASSDCSANGLGGTNCTSDLKAVYYGMGGASIGVGVVLLLVGLHKRQ
jgi:hypothetical protein